MEENQIRKTAKKNNKIVELINKNKLSTTLLCIIILLSLFFLVKIRIAENKAAVELNNIKNNAKIVSDSLKHNSDSLLMLGYKQIVKTFKMAIEEDLTNNKTVRVEEKINFLIKEPNIIKIFIVNSDIKNHRETVGRIIFSTDRKDRENLFFDMKMLRNETFVIKEQDFSQAVTPIADKNSGQIISFLIIQFKN